MMRLPCISMMTWLFVACSFAVPGPKQHKVQYRQQDLPPDLEQSRRGKIQPKVFVVNMVSKHPFAKTRSAQVPLRAFLCLRGVG